ncbi:hypothetical protein [Cohnella lupini]|uniref:Polyprenyl synthetase n=1 Tax=Cohnella lupini TaxID=1294267 RepID=A0A3D9I9C7_9BACL|nr:hypothetical protein [Cohnella lupini]RED58149.1 hypothetical protein DFP95_109187 [Cohnella lupini]
MNGLGGYELEIERIFSEAAEEIARFPSPLDESGLAILARCNPIGGGKGTNQISFLLPYWMREVTECRIETCRDLAVGNLFAMIHYFLMDDVMDHADTASVTAEPRLALALGQLLQTLFFRRYSIHFPADSPLWEHYRDYVSDWAVAVSQEGRTLANPRDPKGLARKSAPVKLCATGLLLLSGQPEAIVLTEEAVDLVLATLQLSDDWMDWLEDLAEEGNNAFLTLVRQRLSLADEEPLDERKVKQSVYRGDSLRMLADIVKGHGERLRAIQNVPADLLSFQASIADGIVRDADRAEDATRLLVTGGGLSYFLSNHTEN